MLMTGCCNDGSPPTKGGDTPAITDHASAPPTSTTRSDDHPTSDAAAASVKLLQDPHAFQTRLALVTYLEHNNGGITLFGFALDRGLLHTLFAFEFSIVLWILSKVIVLS